MTKNAIQEARELGERRVLGAFYTPERLSSILTSWAIRRASDTVLEPSFGGCGFLQSAQERLAILGSPMPKQQIYGCDIDPVAFVYLASVLGSPVDLGRFVHGDFLDVSGPKTWPSAFTAIVANPPYIPYQSLGTDRRNDLSTRSWQVPGVRGRASLWAYFIAHSVSFLAQGGRMAWVLPGAFLQADYAEPIRQYVGKHFSRSAAFVLRERVFLDAGTDEETVILLADGHLENSSASAIELGEATSLTDLNELITRWDDGQWSGRVAERRPAGLSLRIDDTAALHMINSLPSCCDLGDVAGVRIGLVTGANPFFVLSNSGLETARIEVQDCELVMAKFHAAKGVVFDLDDHDQYVANNGHGYLVSDDGTEKNPRINKYLETFDPQKKKAISTFKKRKHWAQTSDANPPHAFFPVMHHNGPRLVLNPRSIHCTNTIHRVFFKDTLGETTQKLIAISLLTSFSQLSAELVGRRYGSGVLKHEPREAERIRILLPKIKKADVDKTFAAVDSALRNGDNARANQLADKLVYAASKLDRWEELSSTLALAVHHVRERRRPTREKAAKALSSSTPAPT